MGWINTIVRETFGLFVEDGSFAAAILIWVAAVWLLLPRLGLSAHGQAVVLFAGLALILLESASRRARR